MALFKINNEGTVSKISDLSSVDISNLSMSYIDIEQDLQKLFEDNLLTILGAHFLQSEYYITSRSKRIDTLGIDEKDCLVIIEYKPHRDGGMITQGLFYLNKLLNCPPDKKAEIKNYAKNITVGINWSYPRLICVAGSYDNDFGSKKLPANIDCITYRIYNDDILQVDDAEFVGPEYRDVKTNVNKINVNELFLRLEGMIMNLNNSIVPEKRKGYRGIPVISYRAASAVNPFLDIVRKEYFIRMYLKPKYVKFDDPYRLVRRNGKENVINIIGKKVFRKITGFYFRKSI